MTDFVDMVRFFEDFVVGNRVESETYTVLRDEITSFARVWDPQPFHLDEKAAAASFYGGLIACSAHIFAIVCKLSNTLEPKAAALGALGFDEIRIPNPLRVGDTVKLSSECAAARRSRSNPARGIVRSALELTNQESVVVFTCQSTYLVQSRPGRGENPE